MIRLFLILSFSLAKSVCIRRRYVLVDVDRGVDVLVHGLELALSVFFEDKFGYLVVVVGDVVVEDLPALDEALFGEVELVFADEALGEQQAVGEVAVEVLVRLVEEQPLRAHDQLLALQQRELVLELRDQHDDVAPQVLALLLEADAVLDAQRLVVLQQQRARLVVQVLDALDVQLFCVSPAYSACPGSHGPAEPSSS